jgi:hypothetical protein
MEGAARDTGSADEDSEVGSVGGREEFVDVGIEEPERGEVLVGPVLIKLVMRSGVFAGVTLSMNWKEGKSRTVVLWSAWSGMGMLEAESMSFYIRASVSARIYFVHDQAKEVGSAGHSKKAGGQRV